MLKGVLSYCAWDNVPTLSPTDYKSVALMTTSLALHKLLQVTPEWGVRTLQLYLSPGYLGSAASDPLDTHGILDQAC